MGQDEQQEPPPAAAPPTPLAGASCSGGAESARIAIFLRLRPVPRPSSRILASPEEGWVEFNVPREATQG